MNRTKVFAVIGVASISALIFCAVQSVRVSVRGTPVAARMFEGNVYVKLSDVAKALDHTVVQKAGGYELVPAGGANALKGTSGKSGEEVFTGKWKFLVRDVQRVDSYLLKYADSKFELKADSGKDLVIVSCRFKNAVQESVNVYFNGLANTAVTDMAEQVYKPTWMDVGGGVASMILPGAAKEFAMVFTVPESAQLKDLIYTIEPVDARKWGVIDLRIALK